MSESGWADVRIYKIFFALVMKILRKVMGRTYGLSHLPYQLKMNEHNLYEQLYCKLLTKSSLVMVGHQYFSMCSMTSCVPAS